MGYGRDSPNDSLVAMFRGYCHDHFTREVKPHWPDAWIDYSKTKVGYDIPITRYFYPYEPPRPLEEIETDIKMLESEIIELLKQVAA